MKYVAHEHRKICCLLLFLHISWRCTDGFLDRLVSRRRVAWSGSPLGAVPDEIGDLAEQLKAQQQQINSLIQVIQQQQQQKPASPSPVVSPVPPQIPYKAMLFIDGTWLYYSLHERSPSECPFVQKYGMGWQNRYDFNWTALPGVICDAVQQAEHYFNRKVEIVRASVYTSSKPDTNKKSNRYKLFEDLRAANYDVNMMETVGTSEKCVDIQLAVDMLHYATDGGGAFDVAFLLTGDKDFMPAMMRTRQKGKAVGLVSMVRGCNRALVETDGLKDFDVLWLENYLDKLVVAKNGTDHDDVVSTFTLNKVIHDFVRLSGFPWVSSRDLGRFLKLLRIRGVSLLDIIKEHYGGLWFFLPSGGQFILDYNRKTESGDKSFTISLSPDSESKLMKEAKETHFTPAEKVFFDKYDVRFLQNRERAYPSTMYAFGLSDRVDTGFYDDCHESANDLPAASNIIIPEYLSRDYRQCTVKELKEVCREHGLPISGVRFVSVYSVYTHNCIQVKAALIHRVNVFMEEDRKKLEAERTKLDAQSLSSKPDSSSSRSVNPEVALHLVDMIEEYLHAKGCEASSRDVGRYLAANKDSFGSRSALTQLKEVYGSLGIFLAEHSNVFWTKGLSGKAFTVGTHKNALTR